MLQAGLKQRVVAARINAHESTVSRLAHRYRVTGNVADRPRSGRPRKTDQRTDRWMVTKVLRNRALTSDKIQAELQGQQVTVSSRLVRNRLKTAGLKNRRPFRGIILTPRHRAARLRWARREIRAGLGRWTRVLVSDESRFCLMGQDGRNRVWRRQGERLADVCINEADRFGGGASVMVWAGISAQYKTDLVFIDGTLTALKYRDDILNGIVRPFLLNHPQIMEFQHDGATPHTARISKNFLAANNIATMEWPSKSPDLSPIANCWDYLSRHLKDRAHHPHNIQQLRQALQQEWQRIPQHYIRNLFNSMRRRLQACINAEGGHTGY